MKNETSDAHLVYMDVVEMRDPATDTWIRRRRHTTFYPDTYSEKDVIQAIREAYLNRVVIGKNAWAGRSKRGLWIEGYNDLSGTIVTAFPLMGQ